MQRSDQIKVLSTTKMIDDLVSLIGKEHVDSIALIQGEIDPHAYELVKGDDEKLLRADLVFYNGLGLEHGASLLSILRAHPHAYAIGESVRKKMPESILELQGQVDPHIWMDISLWKEAAVIIADVLSQKDPGRSEEYHTNAKVLCDQMQNEHLSIVSLLATIPSAKRYLVTSHDAFNYFVHAYLAEPEERETGAWRERLAAPEGLAPDGKLGVKHLQNVIAFLAKHGVRCVFPESNVSKGALIKIKSACASKGHQIKLSSGALYADAMGQKGSGADTYLKMVKHNALLIAKELR